MGVYERELRENDLQLLVKDFTERPDFIKVIQQVKESKPIKHQQYIESKGFEVITTIDSEESKGTIHELTLYLKYENDILIQMTELEVEKEDNTSKGQKMFSVLFEKKKMDKGKEVIEKLALDNGEFTFADTIKASDVNNLAIPTYLEVPHTDEGISLSASPVPCFNWDGSGTCCRFRYNGLPWNPVVTYKWCGANCGNGCGSTPTPVNALDRCCRSHDCCYVNNKSYPARCSCDQILINCARRTDNAGSSRVVVAFQAKMLYFGC